MKISNNNLINGNIFLLFTAFNIQIPYYSGSISSETFTTFLVVLFFYRLIVKDGNQLWKDALVSGMVLGSLYYLRPGFLLFPFILLGLSIFRGLNLNPKFISMQIFFFVLLLLPFGTWNYMNHGVFKISPIGVSGMVALNGYWYFKLPHGYVNTYMWNEVVVPDVTNPFPNIKREKELNRLDYESRWDNFLDSKDIMVDCIGNDEELLAYKNQKTCKSSFSKFILERERFVKNELFSLAWQNKWTYLSERSYSFFRLFFTGINIHKIEKNEGLSKKIMRIYPFLITFGSIFLGFFLSLLVTPKLARSEFNAFIPMLAIVLYVAASHAVFPIQARYLIPMHMLILIMTSISILKFFAYLSSKRARAKN